MPKLPTSYLPDKIRSAVRFVILGSIGTLAQTAFFMLAMWALGQPVKDTVLYYVAFGIGFVLEMIPNYYLSNLYTFGTVPSWKNAGGFLFARALNLVIQFVCLPIMVKNLPTWDDGMLSIVCIFLAGIINYLVLLLFFRNPKVNRSEP